MTGPTQADLGPGDAEPTRCCGRAAIACACGEAASVQEMANELQSAMRGTGVAA